MAVTQKWNIIKPFSAYTTTFAITVIKLKGSELKLIKHENQINSISLFLLLFFFSLAERTSLKQSGHFN